jgi:hypothetical protein
LWVGTRESVEAASVLSGLVGWFYAGIALSYQQACARTHRALPIGTEEGIMHEFRPALLVFVALAAAACGGDGPMASDGVLEVTTEASALKLANVSAAPLHYIVIERGTLALVDWIPCTGGPPCPTLAAGGTTRMPYTAVVGYTASAEEGVAYWWREVTGDSGVARADSLHQMVVSLRPGVWTGVTGP